MAFWSVTMKLRTYSGALAAGILALCAFSHGANASIVVTDDPTNFPVTDSNPIPVINAGGSFTILNVSTPGFALSPWADDVGFTGNSFSVLDAGGGANTTAKYGEAAGTQSVSLLWGSADTYNSITILTTGGGSFTLTPSVATIPDCCQSGVPTHDFMTFTDNVVGNFITGIILSDDGTAAFEYSNVTALPNTNLSTPLPAALPLFAGGLGLMGMLGLRRKRKAPAALAA
jgi:hypothetical protein